MNVHVLVVLAFHGPKPSLSHQVRHLDGVHHNNRPENLRWGTAKENGEDRVIHGVSAKGERNVKAKLTADQVRAIRSQYVRGAVRQVDLAKQYGVFQTQISMIVRRRHWPHVE